MLGKLYKINNNETGFSYVLKREANIILNKIDKNNPTFHHRKEYFDNILNICKAIDKIKPESDDEIKDIMDTINKLYTTGLLSPLTLKDDEFATASDSNYKNNIRYPFILKSVSDGKIINNNAYKAKIYNMYSHDIMAKVFENEPDICYNPTIFINKGGVVTGEYISTCEIRKEVVDKHNYTIQSIVNIPCSLILDNGDRIITVDHREPKLKVLKDFYEVYFKFDKTVHDRKYDIRKYAKMLA